jgi:glutaredoxin 2
MTAALKSLHLQETVVLDDDTDTMVGLVGKRQMPILEKDDGQPMLESMEMVKYIDGLGEPVLTGPERPAIAAWAEATATQTAPLTWPRYPLLGLPEFSARPLHHAQAKGARGFGRTSREDAGLPPRTCASLGGT